MAPKPIWGAITSYFYNTDEQEVETVPRPEPSENEHVDEDGWMLVGPKRAPSPDADEVGSVIMVNHGSDSDCDEPCSKRHCDTQVEAVTQNKDVVKHIKQLNLVEQILFQHNAASVAENATTPKNSWKSRNNVHNKSKNFRVRQANRNPGRRYC